MPGLQDASIDTGMMRESWTTNDLHTPPQLDEAERAILGAILIDTHAIELVRSTLHPEDFSASAHQLIYREMLHLADAGEPIDNVVLVEHLRAISQLTNARGASYIAELTMETVSAAHIVSHARLVSEKALIRKIQTQAVSLLTEIERGADLSTVLSLLPDAGEAWTQTSAGLREDPEPIFLDALDVPSFSTRALPAPWLRDMVEATARATETPVELGLLLGLAVTATTVQRNYVIEPEWGYVETLNIWVSPALDSGNRKTAVLRDMTAPLLEFERLHAAMISHDVTKAEAARRFAEDRIKHLRQKAAKADGANLQSIRDELFNEESALPEVPRAIRLWAQDVTPEKLGQLMADHHQAMAILSDEGGLFDILAGRYSQGVPNLDLFLQAHSGAPYRVDRGSRPAIFMESPVLTIGLSPQPSVLMGLAKHPGFRGRGLLARFLYALPQSTLGHRTLTAAPIPAEVRNQYAAHLHALLKRAPHTDGHPHRIHLSGDALHEWKAFQRHVEDELGGGGKFEPIKDWASKLPGGVARLAGILHCAVHADGAPVNHEVDLTTMEAALELGALLERHALATFSLMAVDTALEAAQKVWAWILRQKQPRFSKRDCCQALKGTFPDSASLQPAFEALVERGYLFPITPDRRVGRPSPSYRVNSRLAKEWQS